jgi:hypothetical protein
MRNRDKSFKTREKGAKNRDKSMQNRDKGTKNRAGKDRSSAAAGADSVFWAEHNYDSSRTGYFSYAPTPTLRCGASTGTHACSRPPCAATSIRCRKSCTRQPPRSTRSALNGNSGNTLGYSRVLSGTLGYSQGAGRAAHAGVRAFPVRGYSPVLTGTHGVLTGTHGVLTGYSPVLTGTHGVLTGTHGVLTGYSA